MIKITNGFKRINDIPDVLLSVEFTDVICSLGSKIYIEGFMIYFAEGVFYHEAAPLADKLQDEFKTIEFMLIRELPENKVQLVFVFRSIVPFNKSILEKFHTTLFSDVFIGKRKITTVKFEDHLVMLRYLLHKFCQKEKKHSYYLSSGAVHTYPKIIDLHNVYFFSYDSLIENLDIYINIIYDKTTLVNIYRCYINLNGLLLYEGKVLTRVEKFKSSWIVVGDLREWLLLNEKKILDFMRENFFFIYIL